MVNGFSGFESPLMGALESRDRLFPSAQTIAELAELGVRFLIIDAHLYGDRPLQAELDALDALATFAGQHGESYVYELRSDGRGDERRVGAPRLAARPVRVEAEPNAALATFMVDADPGTRWHSGPQRPGAAVLFGFAEPVHLTGLSLLFAGSPMDYPRAYRVEVSADRERWTRVAEAASYQPPLRQFLAPRDLRVDIRFPDTTARWVRVEQTGRDDVYYWSIYEVDFLGAAVQPD
jgi:hypothetical protein